MPFYISAGHCLPISKIALYLFKILKSTKYSNEIKTKKAGNGNDASKVFWAEQHVHQTHEHLPTDTLKMHSMSAVSKALLFRKFSSFAYFLNSKYFLLRNISYLVNILLNRKFLKSKKFPI